MRPYFIEQRLKLKNLSMNCSLDMGRTPETVTKTFSAPGGNEKQ
jgi:S-adenosylmethionine synthetase